jgi:hypothetical protein
VTTLRPQETTLPTYDPEDVQRPSTLYNAGEIRSGRNNPFSDLPALPPPVQQQQPISNFQPLFRRQPGQSQSARRR